MKAAVSYFCGVSLLAAQMQQYVSAFVVPMPALRVAARTFPSPLEMISTGDDRPEYSSLRLEETTYTSTVKQPADAYRAFAAKGASNAKMSKRKILHQSILAGAYVGFGALLSFEIAGNLGGLSQQNPGIPRIAFAALFPVNLLLIQTTGGQLFTGNSATVTAAKLEGLVEWREVWRSLTMSLLGNIIGCGLFAAVAVYSGCFTPGGTDLCLKLASSKCSYTFGQTLMKAILCNWMVSLAVFLANASNDLVGKLVGCWFPISTFVAIGLEHSVANLFLMPAALLLSSSVSFHQMLFKNIIPVILGNAISGSIVFSGSYSYQFGRLGRRSRQYFRTKLRKYEIRKKRERLLAERLVAERLVAKQQVRNGIEKKQKHYAGNQNVTDIVA